MITDPDPVRILCFGDSNTFGTCLHDSCVDGTPTKDPDYVRLKADRRWTGVLQRLLGDGYDVIEEGLNGRTTDLDDEHRPGLNGRSYFQPCLLSHQPLDVVVIMLGGNDLKPSYNRTADKIADALGAYVDDVAAYATDRRGRVPAAILVGHTSIDDTAPRYRDLVGENIDPQLPDRFPRAVLPRNLSLTRRCDASLSVGDVACTGNSGHTPPDPAKHCSLASALGLGPMTHRTGTFPSAIRRGPE